MSTKNIAFDAATLDFRSRAVKQVDLFQDLTYAQKETFMVLLPNWFGSVEELINTSKLLNS